MTEETETQEKTKNDKEYNFRALEQKYQKELEEARKAKEELEKKLNESNNINIDDDDDDEPYVDKKKLAKTLNKFGEHTQKQTRSEIEKAVGTALKEEKKQQWLKNNPDFYDVMKLADKLAEHDEDLANDILSLPNGFERQKIAYKHIKALKLHEPAPKEPSVQEKIDLNRRSPYYQPSGSATAPYGAQGDFSASGQKAAYEKLQQLKKNLRI